MIRFYRKKLGGINMGKFYVKVDSYTRKARGKNKPKEGDNTDRATTKIQKSFGLGNQWQ